MSHDETNTDERLVFRFHMPTEPSSLDPAKLSTSDASYFLTNVMRGLYTYDDVLGLIPEGAKTCRFLTPLQLECDLAERRWSDGSRIVADDYVRAFRRLVQPKARSLSLELLKTLRNAVAIHKGERPNTDLGVRALGVDRLHFDFAIRDPDFLYKLTYSVLVPVKRDSFPDREQSADAIVNGPYRVANWQVGRRLRLEPNPSYDERVSTRPPVEILILDDDETALNLYEQSELTFLRRLPTTYIPQYRGRADFLQKPVLRFDYLGFGVDLEKDPDLRRALSLSLDYEELASILDAAGRPGCAGLATEFFTELPCLHFDLERARRALDASRNGADASAKPILLTFSKLGGDDVKKAAEWFQAQWKKHLGLDVRLQQLEQSVQLQTLRTHAPPIYRKGLHPERPTCLAAMEIFAKDGPDNFSKIVDPIFEKAVHDLTGSSRGRSSQNRRGLSLAQRRTCTKAVQRLLDQSRLIPLGRVHFTLLTSPKFRGWSLNEMNQLNLAGLEVSP